MSRGLTSWHRNLVATMSGGGGGGGLPERTTVPTFRQALGSAYQSASNDFAYDTTALTDDRSVFHHYITNVGGATPTAINLTAIEAVDDSITESPIGTAFGYQVIAEAGRKTILADTEANITTSVTPSSGLSNIQRGVVRVIFVGSSVDGDPTLQRVDAFDADPLPEGFSLVSNTLTFPTIEVPTGYTAVYTFQITNTLNTYTWATATERLDTSSFAGTGWGGTAATLAGPDDGTGVTLTQAGLGAAIAGRGCTTSIYLVPGT